MKYILEVLAVQQQHHNKLLPECALEKSTNYLGRHPVLPDKMEHYFDKQYTHWCL